MLSHVCEHNDHYFLIIPFPSHNPFNSVLLQSGHANALPPWSLDQEQVDLLRTTWKDDSWLPTDLPPPDKKLLKIRPDETPRHTHQQRQPEETKEPVLPLLNDGQAVLDDVQPSQRRAGRRCLSGEARSRTQQQLHEFVVRRPSSGGVIHRGRR